MLPTINEFVSKYGLENFVVVADSGLIEAHICICFVALKVYKELERMLKVSEIKMSVDKVLALAKTITTIQIRLPLNKEVYTQTMLMARHQKIAKLFDEDFWVTQ